MSLRLVRSTLLAAAGLLSGVPALAQEPAPAAAPPAAEQAPPPPPPTKLTLDLGFVNAAGNTRVTTLSFAENLSYKREAWGFRELGKTVYGRTGDSTTAEQVNLDGRLEFRLVTVLRLFVGTTYERNRLAGIARRFEEYVGLAVSLVDRASDELTLEAGSSVNQDRSTASVEEHFAALRSALHYRHSFTKAAYLQGGVETTANLSDGKDWRLNGEAALVAPLAGRAALKVSYAVKYNHLPAPGFQGADRVLTTALQIVF